MDRSFLSSQEIIDASRDFVCIRIATYEDRKEAEFLKTTFLRQARDGLRNFGFCILSPDGETKLRKSDRGPNFLYKDSKEMAADLRRIAKDHESSATSAGAIPTVPQMKSVRLGINVASCDGLPCVVAFGKNQADVDRLNRTLAKVIWDSELAGKYVYASTSNRDDLKNVSGSLPKSG